MNAQLFSKCSTHVRIYIYIYIVCVSVSECECGYPVYIYTKHIGAMVRARWPYLLDILTRTCECIKTVCARISICAYIG